MYFTIESSMILIKLPWKHLKNRLKPYPSGTESYMTFLRSLLTITMQMRVPKKHRIKRSYSGYMVGFLLYMKEAVKNVKERTSTYKFLYSTPFHR